MTAFIEGIFFQQFWGQALAVLADSGIKGVVLLALAFLITLSLRRGSAAARHLVWALALGGLLLLPILSLALPKWQLPILPRTVLTVIPARVMIAPPPPIVPQEPRSEISPATPAGPLETVGPSEKPISKTTARQFPARPLPISFWLVSGWFTVTLAALVPLLAGFVLVGRLIRQARRLEHDPWPSLLRSLSERLGLRRRVRVLRTNGATMPMSVGVWRPTILLPREVEEWTEEKRRAVLLHELAHVKRRDCLTHVLGRLACAAHWFNPLAWAGFRRLQAERERACDDLVLSAGARAAAYADQLLEIARTMHAKAFTSAAAITMARRSQLEGRLLAILDAARNRRYPKPRNIFAGVCVALCLVVPLAMAQIGNQKDSASPETAKGVTAPGLDPGIEAVFADLEANWEKRGEFSWNKWKGLTSIEQAKYLDKWTSPQSQPARVQSQLSSNRTEEEAARFVEKCLGPGPDENWRNALGAKYRVTGADLTKEEAAPFNDVETSLTQRLAEIAKPAAESLLSRIQGAPTEGKAERELSWTANALERIGEPAIPAIAREVEEAFKTMKTPPRWGTILRMRCIIQALARIPSPQAIAPLRRALDSPDTSVRLTALEGLDGTPGGLTQDILLGLWEDEDYGVRHQSVLLLARKYGDEKAIGILERDIPTAYAIASYNAEEAVWQIKSRLGKDPGPRPPRPVLRYKGDSETLYEGVEKSLHSPNKGIRITAIQTMAQRDVQSDGSLKPLISILREDPDKTIRRKAAGALANAFVELSRKMRKSGELPGPLRDVFLALADATAKDEEEVAVAAMSVVVRSDLFKDDPAYAGMIERILNGLSSRDIAMQSKCLFAVGQIWRNDPEKLQERLSAARKAAISKTVMTGLDSDYGRFWVDAIDVAGQMGLDETIPKLIEFVEKGEEPIRRNYAASALGKIGDARALPALERMAVNDPHVLNGVYVNRDQAKLALKSIRERVGTSDR
jgi:beta-lactamase regulating signal transducer with metallopeptidase domain/HEAT repeat protein